MVLQKVVYICRQVSFQRVNTRISQINPPSHLARLGSPSVRTETVRIKLLAWRNIRICEPCGQCSRKRLRQARLISPSKFTHQMKLSFLLPLPKQRSLREWRALRNFALVKLSSHKQKHQEGMKHYKHHALIMILFLFLTIIIIIIIIIFKNEYSLSLASFIMPYKS